MELDGTDRSDATADLFTLPSLPERVAALRRWAAEVPVGAVVVVVGAAVLAFLLLRPADPPVEDVLPLASPAPPAPTLEPDPTSAAGSPAATEQSELVVHVAGSVLHPGVVRVGAGARVADVIAAAGGLGPDADGERLNLAAPVADGQRLYVPRMGQDVIPEPLGPDGGAGPGPSGSGSGPSSGGAATGSAGGADLGTPVDLNRASIDELDTLPGVGPATAAAIVAHREEHGPFTSVDGLLDVRGIGEAKLAALRDLVTV